MKTWMIIYHYKNDYFRAKFYDTLAEDRETDKEIDYDLTFYWSETLNEYIYLLRSDWT